MFHHRPALRLFLLFAAGIILAAWIPLPPRFLFAFISAVVGFAVLLYWLNRWTRVADIALECSVVLLGVFLQTIQLSNFQSREITPRIDDEVITVFGTVDSEPLRQDRRLNCVVNTDSMIRQGKLELDTRRMIVLLRLEKKDHTPAEIQFGRRIELTGMLEPFPFQRNPGEFDYSKYLELNDIQGILSVKGLDHIRVGDIVNGNFVQHMTYSIQQTLYRILDTLHTARHSSFLKGIIFGYRADIPTDVKQSFMDTGTIHILAVSGSNVAFVAFIFFSILGLLRLPRKAIGAVTIFGLVLYMAITGSSASVVRATIMAVVLLCATLLERKADIYNSISVAAVILLFWNTNTLFDVGFQLSFAAVTSIVYFYPRLESLIQKIPERFEEIKGVDTVLKLFAVSLAAQLGTIPFIAYYFGRISLISLVANIPVVPISGLNTFIGAAEVITFPVSPWVAQCYAAVNECFVWFLLGFVKQAASLPFASIDTLQLSPAVVIGYYALVIGIFHWYHPRVRALALVFFFILGNFVLYRSIWRTAHPQIHLTMIDVGQGDATCIEFPNGKRILVDCGPLTQKFDAGERTVVPYLKRNGISRVDYVVITHPHSDHLGGAGSVLTLLQTDTLFLATPFADSREVSVVRDIAEKRNTAICVARAGDQIHIDSTARVYILAPDILHCRERNLNNSSVVLKIVYGNSTLLLVGDAEVPAEHRLQHRYSSFLSSAMMKAGHHGSITSSSEEFLKAVHPQRALISVGIHNKFRHPSPFTLHRMKSHSIEVLRTDRSGALMFESDGSKWTQTEWRKMP